STEEEPVEEEPVVPLRKHILVVDDDPMMLKLIKEHLHEDYDVATAVNGKIALKFLERRTTDLILLDYEMPTENGPAILEKLRAEKSTKDIPVIFLTGVKERDKIHTALSLKPQGYLLKPIDHKKLLEAINKILQ
ncbi:MAG: response regulator, partial [Acetatifactor sp.]|nr:response regulator [Acetatifactor sp.]